MVVIVTTIAVATATHVERLEPAVLKRFGFAPLHIPGGDLARLLTSVFLTAGGISFYRSLAMLALCAGLCERLAGSLRTLLTFWGVHLATLLILSMFLAIPLHHLDVWWGTLLATEHDVGPSAGYYGCLGLVCWSQHPSRRAWLCALIGLILVARLVWTALAPTDGHASLGADVAHLIAFSIGVALGAKGGYFALRA